MLNQKKQPASSRLKSLYLSCRSRLSCSNASSSVRLAINPTLVPKKQSAGVPPSQNNNRRRLSSTNSNETAVEGNFRRVCDLETELQELEEWLCSELTRLKSHLGSASNNNNDNDDNNNNNGEMSRANNTFERIDFEGSYLYNFNGKKMVDGDSQNLSIQVSTPALVPHEPGSTTISEVLNKMAGMGKEKLMTCLLESMPMPDISTSNTKGRLSHVINSSISSTDNNPSNVLEAILRSSIDKLHDVVMEGIQIQMGTKEVVKWEEEEAKDGGVGNEGSIILVVLVQARDPKAGYEAVNEMMIGLIEARDAENEEEEEAGFCIKGVYVAGLVARRTNGEVIHNCLWCVSS